jgi:MFS family permease
VVLWGIATASTAANDYKSFLAARIFLVIFEAVIAPFLMLISSQWYTKSEQAPRFSLWYYGLGLGQVIGGIVNYGFQRVDTSFAGWRIMFAFLGCSTVLIGFVTLIFLPNTPMAPRFLSDTDKAALLYHISTNQTSISNPNFKPSQILELPQPQNRPPYPHHNPHLHLLGRRNNLLRNPNQNNRLLLLHSAPFNTPSGLISILSTLLVGLAIRTHSRRRLRLILPISNKPGLLAGVYLVNSITATLIIIYQWTTSNIAGHTKRIFAMALVSGSFSVGNIVGPQTFQARDASQFILAKDHRARDTRR